jgi:hypothetical protein
MSRGPLLFLSHSGVDTEPARELKRRLLASPEAKAARLEVWFDKDDLVPGKIDRSSSKMPSRTARLPSPWRPYRATIGKKLQQDCPSQILRRPTGAPSPRPCEAISESASPSPSAVTMGRTRRLPISAISWIEPTGPDAVISVVLPGSNSLICSAEFVDPDCRVFCKSST